MFLWKPFWKCNFKIRHVIATILTLGSWDGRIRSLKAAWTTWRNPVRGGEGRAGRDGKKRKGKFGKMCGPQSREECCYKVTSNWNHKTRWKVLATSSKLQTAFWDHILEKSPSLFYLQFPHRYKCYQWLSCRIVLPVNTIYCMEVHSIVPPWQLTFVQWLWEMIREREWNRGGWSRVYSWWGLNKWRSRLQRRQPSMPAPARKASEIWRVALFGSLCRRTEGTGVKASLRALSGSHWCTLVHAQVGKSSQGKKGDKNWHLGRK